MKTIFRFFFIVVASLMVTGTLVPSARAISDPFVGKWNSIDTDGSYQILTIGGCSGNSYPIRVYDFGASTCGLDPETCEILYAASLEGNFSLSDGILSGTLPLYCQTSPPTFDGDAFLQFTYDPATDTLIDNFGVVWSH